MKTDQPIASPTTFETALGFVLDAVSETAVVEAEVSLEIEPDGTRRVDVAIRSQIKQFTPTTIIREHSGGETM